MSSLTTMIKSVEYFSFLYSVPPTSLLYGSRYDKIATAFNAKGYNAATIPELGQVLSKVFGDEGPVIVNVVVHPNSARKAQVCARIHLQCCKDY